MAVCHPIKKSPFVRYADRLAGRRGFFMKEG